MAHAGHLDCVYTTKAACDKARREKLGRCTEMTADKKQPKQCAKWATSLINGRGVCDMHAGMILERVRATARKIERQLATIAAIDEYIAWRQDHPSVWDQRTAPAP